MTMPTATRKAFDAGVRNKQNFSQGNTRGYWYSPNEITDDVLGGLPVIHREIIQAQNKRADLFVVYAYSTPIAWFSLKGSDSQGTNKWYFPTVRYSESIDQFQHSLRVIFRDMSNVAKLLPSGRQMKNEKPAA